MHLWYLLRPWRPVREWRVLRWRRTMPTCRILPRLVPVDCMCCWNRLRGGEQNARIERLELENRYLLDRPRDKQADAIKSR